MPPRRPLSEAASANETEADGRTSATSTPKRMMKLYRIRDNSATPSNANSSPDELTKQSGSDEEAVLDEIVVSRTPQKINTKAVDFSSGSAVGSNLAETPRLLRRSSRTSSISQRGSPAASPLDRGVTMKRQDFGIAISGDDDGKPDELSLPPRSKKRKVDPKPVPRVSFRKSRSKWDNPDEMLTDPNSPLVKAKLRELLCSPMAWDVLTREEKEQILSKFPDDTKILDPDTPNAHPDIAALLNNNNFRNDVTRYQEGLGKGFHDPEWIQQAQAAHRSREAGVYDDFMAADFKEKWDMPMPKQSQTGLNESGSDSHQVDSASEGQAKSASIEQKTTNQSEGAANMRQGTSDSLKVQSTEIPHPKSIEVSVKDRNGMENTNDSRVAPTDSPSSTAEIEDQPVEGAERQGGPIQVAGVITPNSTELDSQQLDSPNRNARISSVPLFPDVMEGLSIKSQRNRLK
ncbi:Asx homology domain-containing protein [Ustulina deusta]|nr:Asx homology domain-containing protein [Ustulina deusta]